MVYEITKSQEQKSFAMSYPNTTKACTHLSLGVCQCTKTKTVAATTAAYHGNRWWGYSTNLMLYDDPWKIKMVLQESDLDEWKSMLLLPKDMTEELVLPVLGFGADPDRGTLVRIYDVDTNTMHVLVLKTWFSSGGNYAFIGNWVQDFVIRRELNRGDEIGLHWDPYKRHFNFSVLYRTIRM